MLAARHVPSPGANERWGEGGLLWGLGFSLPPHHIGLPVPASLVEGAACSSGGTLAIGLRLPPDEAIQSAAVGSHAAFAVTTRGRVLAFGSEQHGRLGHAQDHSMVDEDHVPGLHEVEGLGHVVQVVAGAEHAFALNTEGAVFAWGSDVSGRLGIGARAAQLCRAGHLPFTSAPVRVNVGASAAWGFHPFSNKRVVGIACGDLHCLALTADEEVYAWGSASMGRLGLGDTSASGEVNEPLLVTRLVGKRVVQIACSKVNSGAVCQGGEMFTWGATCYGITWSPTNGAAAEVPTLLPVPDGQAIAALAMGKLHALALGRNGSVYAFGWAGDGALGLGPPVDGGNLCRAVTQPTPLPALAATTVHQVACSECASFALSDENRLLLWGSLPIPPQAVHPVCGSHDQNHLPRAWGRGADGTGAVVLWPSLLREPPAGRLELPVMGYASSALLMIPGESKDFADAGLAMGCGGLVPRQENPSANLVQVAKPLLCCPRVRKERKGERECACIACCYAYIHTALHAG